LKYLLLQKNKILSQQAAQVCSRFTLPKELSLLMPKPIYQPDPELLFLLKEKIAEVAGTKPESKNDCASVSDLIMQNTKEYVSESTLYRFFFNADGHIFYKNTLDKLSRFCGSDNWEQFCRHYENDLDRMIQNGMILSINHKSLIQSCIVNQEFKSLFHFFENLPHGLNDSVRRRLGIELYQGLLSNKKSNEIFYQIFSKSSFVRTLLFEELADPDFKIKDQFKLYKWYLKNSDKQNDTEALQEFIFAHVLLFRYHYKTGNKKEILKTGALLYQNAAVSPLELNKIHVFPRSRWYAYRLWYSQANNFLHYNEYRFELIEWCRKAAVDSNIENKNIVFYNTFDALVSLGEMDFINEKLIPLFFSNQSLKHSVHDSVEHIMKRIEPNGLKRFFTAV
jgi:hypothetical protein